MLSKTWAALAVALTLPLLNACGIDDVDDGHVRIVNATTDYSSVDLYTQDSNGNDNLVVSGTAAGAVSGYTNVKRGSSTFEIKSGSSAGNASSATGTVTTDDHFTLVSYITGNTLDTVFLSDNEDSPGSGNAKLRVLNGATTEAGSVDVYLSQNACSALSTTDTAFAAAVAGPSAGAAFTTAYSQVSAASGGTSWNLCVTTSGDKSTVLVDIPTFTLKDQEIATLILTRTSGGFLLNAAVLDQQGSLQSFSNAIARVRVVSDAASAATVSATVNNVVLASDAGAATVGSYMSVTAGALSGTFAINDTQINGANLGSVTAGSDYTLLVTGTVGEPVFTLIADDNTPSTSSSAPVKVRAVNGVNGVVGTVSASIDAKSVGSGLAFGSASSYVNVPATSGTSTVRANAGTTTIAPLTDQSFTSAGVYTIFVLGDASAPQIIQSVDR